MILSFVSDEHIAVRQLLHDGGRRELQSRDDMADLLQLTQMVSPALPQALSK